MIKLVTNTGYTMNSYNIVELWEFIVSNDFSYTFYIDFVPISYDEFMKLFLKKTKRWTEYHLLYKKLKPTITLKDYL